MSMTNNYDYTLKGFYYPDLSDEETKDLPTVKSKPNVAKRSINKNIEAFFEKTKKRKSVSQSSNVGHSNGDGISYISANNNDSNSATHLIKIELYDIEKLKNVEPTDYWKHADIRVKYYAASEENKNYQNTRDIIYNITKELANTSDCKKYFIENK